MDWGKLSPDEISRIVNLYNTGGEPAVDADAKQLGIKTVTLARHCRNYNQYKRIMENAPVLKSGIETDVTGDFITLPFNLPTPRLTDLTRVPADSDAARWIEFLLTRSATDHVLTVMHACDVHAPYHDPVALDLFYQIVANARPDVVVVGSDFADFYGLSSFATNPDRNEEGADVLDCFEIHWKAHIDAILAASPGTIPVFIFGNHERRLLRFLMDNGKKVRKRMLRSFVETVQQGGKVLYLGEVDHARMGPLQVEHGSRVGDNSPKARLLDEGGQISLMFGHVHKENFFSIRGADYTVKAISSGCLCLTTPHYANPGQSSLPGRKWTNGTVVATLSLNDRLVNYEIVEFQGSVCYFRGVMLENKNAI